MSKMVVGVGAGVATRIATKSAREIATKSARIATLINGPQGSPRMSAILYMVGVGEKNAQGARFARFARMSAGGTARMSAIVKMVGVGVRVCV